MTDWICDPLESAGFPLVTEQVDGQTRWKLLDGFQRLPALGFAQSELMALVYLPRPLQGIHIHAALDSAMAKVWAALPRSGLHRCSHITDAASPSR